LGKLLVIKVTHRWLSVEQFVDTPEDQFVFLQRPLSLGQMSGFRLRIQLVPPH
jgi:hypothetical protein